MKYAGKIELIEGEFALVVSDDLVEILKIKEGDYVEFTATESDSEVVIKKIEKENIENGQ